MPADDAEEKTEATRAETRILDANFAIVDIPDGNDRCHPRTRSRDRFFSLMNRIRVAGGNRWTVSSRNGSCGLRGRGAENMAGPINGRGETHNP